MHQQDWTFPAHRRRHVRQPCRIAATASYLPPGVVTNDAIIAANHLPVTDAVIRKTLGVAERRVTDAGMADSDLLVRAARRCLARAGIGADQVSRILVTKLIGDRVLPMTAALVQRKLDARVAMHAVDLEGGINAFLYALDLASRYISTTAAPQRILVLSGGLHVLPVSKTDPRLAFLFGDGAGAVLLETADEPHLLASYAYTNFAYFAAASTKALIIDQDVSDRLFEQKDSSLLYDLYRMGNWKDSLAFYLEAACVTRDRLLEESGLAMRDIDWVLVTENNARIRESTLAALGVPEERSLSVIRRFGNTMSAMLPILLNEAFEGGYLKTGMHVMLISHGEGASGGGVIYRV